MAIGEVFVGALLQVLVEKVATGAFAQIMKHVKGVRIDKNTIRHLEEKLRWVAAMLQDAEHKEQDMLQSQEYKIWVEKLQDLAYDLEDILDKLATDAQLLQLQQADDNDDDCGSKGCNTTCFQSAKTKVKNIVACGSGAMQCFQYPGSGDLPSKIKEICSRLEESHVKGRDRLGLSDQIVIQQEMYPSLMQNSSRETTFLMSEPIIYGREKKKTEIIQMLINNEETSNENYDVIAIVGKGGLGKTTLTQYVYNDHTLNDYFSLKAWVCVSDTVFNVIRITTDIINSATKENLTFSNLNQPQDKLAKELKDKRFLIVLDDVWTEDYNDWQQLQTPFLHGARGSKVIVTTRIEETARNMITNPASNIIHLEKLSDKDCWHLFMKHACLEPDDDVTEMKNDIITKCGGLPLAAKALGGLFKKAEKSQHPGLLKSGIWREKGKVLPVLRLSYFHLPSHLKHVFAYCSIFPKDYKFEEREVIFFWMAQGMLPENREDSMEVIGHHYFLELVSNSLFERSPFRSCYVMHDLVHDLSQWAAGDLCLYVMDTSDLQGNLTRTRHLNLRNNVINQVDQHASAHQLRTLMCQPQSFINSLNLGDFISRFESIRTLFLASDTIPELPECIGDLKLIRYLDLEFPNIRVLPKSICKLCKLQTLLLSGCGDLKEFTSLRFLVKLRHVRFPESLWQAMPVGIRKLTNLQTMGDVILGDDHGRRSLIRELRNLNHLHGELNVFGLENVRNVEDAREAQLHEKKGLKRLGLMWSVDRKGEVDEESKRDVLEQLKPNSCIKECELNGYSGLALPSWLGDPSFKNMVDITLENCHKCEQLPPLGQLPSLEKLVIVRCESFQGTLPPLLPCLKILKIEKCPQAKVSLPSSPKLEVLRIDSCEALLSSTDLLVIHCSKKMHLESIKSCATGLQVDGPCREELFIVWCDSLVSIKKIPVTVEKVTVRGCVKLERVEWEEVSTSSASNHNGVSIEIFGCESVLHVGTIPLLVASLHIVCCFSLEYVMFGDKWNLLKSSEAIHGDSNGPRQLQLAQLVDLCISNYRKSMSLTGVLMPSLRHLRMVCNHNVDVLPQAFPNVGLPTSLVRLEVVRMKIPQRIQEWGLDRLTHLKDLTIVYIGHSGDSIECIIGTDIKDDDDDTVLHLPSTSLCELVIGGFQSLKTIRPSTFPNLTKLSIRGSILHPHRYPLKGMYDLPRYLKKLDISNVYTEKPIQEWGLDLLTHLQYLTIDKIRWRGDSVERIVGKDVRVDKDDTHIASTSRSSSALYLPSISLRRLCIHGCPDNENLIEQQSTSDLIQGVNDLTSINCSTFPNLTGLTIWGCPKLESLGPNNYLPPTLKFVQIIGSPLIEQQSTSDPHGVIRFADSQNRYTISIIKEEPKNHSN